MASSGRQSHRWLVLTACSVAIGHAAVRAENLAYDKPSPSINPKLTAHSQTMEQRVYKLTDRVYVAVGFDVANSTMVIGEDGIVIIDTLQTVESGKTALAEFRKITDKPLKAIVYTHHHSDHVGGVKAFTTEDDVRAGKVAVYAHKDLLTQVISRAPNGMMTDIVMPRSYYALGAYLPSGPEGLVNNGVGPILAAGVTTFITPTHTFTDTLDITVAGVRLQLLHSPSETNDMTTVWMPDLRVLHSGEVLQGESFPNLYTLRGGEMRDPITWYKSLDRLREFPAEYLAPGHGRPVSGADAVAATLTNYRDAIQYVHDQTVRYMNKGYTPDELVEVVSELPPRLRDQPWLGEFYGAVKHTVRQIYFSYFGWFTGDPATLEPVPPADRAQRYLAMMGGRQRVVSEAQRALKAKDYRWAADILTHAIRANTADMEARRLKAEALRQLGFQQTSANYRNWYLTSALELEGKPLDFVQPFWRMHAAASASTRLAVLPAANILESLAVRLDASKSANVHQTMAFTLSDSGQTYALEIRGGIAQFHSHAPAKVDVTLTTTKRILDRLAAHETSVAKAVGDGQATVTGDRTAAETFLGYFEAPTPRSGINLTVR